MLALVTGMMISCSLGVKRNNQVVHLEDRWDTIRPLANPDKGWYHHMLDNGIGKYLIQDESELYQFPGMDHLYLRLAWAFLEPGEGKYDWSYIDDIVEKYVPQGYQISFRISCKETGGTPYTVPEEINGVFYATPSWVQKAGAKGVVPDKLGPPVWTPDWDDPVYLEKLGNFHRAFAEKYDGKPWVRYVDVGSIGEWGEGNAHRSTGIAPTEEEVRANIDIYLKHYKHSQLVVTDDLVYWHKPDAVVNRLVDYVVDNGITFRDDSPLVRGYVERNLDTWTVSHPHFYERVYRELPTVFELQHYGAVKRDGNWLGDNGEDTIPGLGVSGAEIFRNAIKLIHPTYIGFHGYIGEWYNDNPELTDELLNLCGYWYFPVSFTFNSGKDDEISFHMDWLNKGVAPAYNTYMLKGKLTPANGDGDATRFEIADAGNLSWMPGEVAGTDYTTNITAGLRGDYILSVQLFDERSGRPVEIGLQEKIRDGEGHYIIGTIEL